jgi:hypothetical protein
VVQASLGSRFHAYRRIAGRIDEVKDERLDGLEEPFRVYRCHDHELVHVCSKGLNPPTGGKRTFGTFPVAAHPTHCPIKADHSI